MIGNKKGMIIGGFLIKAFEAYQSLKIFEMISDSMDNMKITNVEVELWNKDYEAINLCYGNTNVKSRLAKKTPKKKGYFIAVWRKNNANMNEPFTYQSFQDRLVVNVSDGHYKGQFVFPKSVLIEHGIVSSQDKKGKMAMRLYPSWETDLNKTAYHTQCWQTKYFVDLTYDVDLIKVNELYFLNNNLK